MNRIPAKQYLGIDIGGTSAKCAVIDQTGKILHKDSFATGTAVSQEQFLHSLLRTADNAVKCGIVGIGICCLGIVNSHTGEILGGVENMPYLNGLNLKTLLSQRYPKLPICISNDVKAVARGEQWLGAAKDCRSFACVALGTGLGGAVVIDGRLVEGAHFRAGEICYTDYHDSDEYLEKHTSTMHVMEQAAGELGVAGIDGFAFFRMVRDGNAVCCAVLDQWIGRIARFIANILVLLDLEAVIIGGGVSREGDVLIPLLSKAVDERLPPAFRGQARIVAAKHAGDAGVLGAVSSLASNTESEGSQRWSS